MAYCKFQKYICNFERNINAVLYLNNLKYFLTVLNGRFFKFGGEKYKL